MKIANNILKHYLKNVYFITGTAYAGKSTAVKMLAERYDMVFCGENYHMAVSEIVATPETHPDLCYNKMLTDWKDFVTRTPEEYERWLYSVGREAAEFEIAELISLSKDTSIVEIEIKPEWVGKNLIELNLRKKHGFNVVAIREGKKVTVDIDPEQPLSEHITLIVLANTTKLAKFK